MRATGAKAKAKAKAGGKNRGPAVIGKPPAGPPNAQKVTAATERMAVQKAQALTYRYNKILSEGNAMQVSMESDDVDRHIAPDYNPNQLNQAYDALLEMTEKQIPGGRETWRAWMARGRSDLEKEKGEDLFRLQVAEFRKASTC